MPCLLLLLAIVSAHGITDLAPTGGLDATFLDDEIQDIKNFLFALCYIIGISFIFTAIFSLKKFGQQGAFMQDTKAGILGPTIRLFMGVAFMAVSQFLDIFYETIWGYNVAESQSIELTTDQLGLADAITPLKNIIYIIGLVSFIRGWIILVKATSAGQAQPGTVSKGAIHIIGGVLAMNIQGTVQMIQESMVN